MSLETKVPLEIAGTPMLAHLTANFEKAERNIRETYGMSPSMPDLMRMWVASATSWDIQVEFERTVLSLKRGTAQPNKEGNFDEDSFEF